MITCTYAFLLENPCAIAIYDAACARANGTARHFSVPHVIRRDAREAGDSADHYI